MTLTHNDLQAISQIVEEKLESKLEEKLESKLEEKLESKLEEKLESKLKPIRQEINKIAAIQKDTRKIRKDLETAIDHFDRADIAYEKRLEALENHTIHPPIPAI